MNTASDDRSFPQPRRPRGSADGGQFAAFRQQDQDGSLTEPDTSDNLIPEPASGPDTDETAALVGLASRRRPAPADLGGCLEHHRPLAVRLAAVSNPAHPIMTAYAASGDPEPMIRAHALLSPWLDADRRGRLMADPAVMTAASRLTGDEFTQVA